MTRQIAIIGAGSPSLSNPLLAASILAPLAWVDPPAFIAGMPAACGIRMPQDRTVCRCALPGCERMTTHNGGYCCADHCREHRQRQRTTNTPEQARAGSASHGSAGAASDSEGR